MGIEYCLYKPEKKERFDLGKGCWGFLYRYEHFNDPYQLYCDILRHTAFRFNLNTNLLYFDRLARRISVWVDNDKIEFYTDDRFFDKFCDTKFYADFEKEYPTTGTRHET